MKHVKEFESSKFNTQLIIVRCQDISIHFLRIVNVKNDLAIKELYLEVVVYFTITPQGNLIDRRRDKSSTVKLWVNDVEILYESNSFDDTYEKFLMFFC